MKVSKIKLTSVLIVILLLTLVSIAFFFGRSGPSIVRVACLGDSLTEITGYPEELQVLLGTDYHVEKFGVIGATILFNTDRPFLNQSAFSSAKDFDPGIVVIMLGTNDARTNIYASSDNLEVDFKTLVNSIKAFASTPKVFVALPPPLFNNTLSLSVENLENGVIPRIRAVSNELQLPLIDVYNALSGHPEYFPDGVHPDQSGTKAIADVVFEALRS